MNAKTISLVLIVSTTISAVAAQTVDDLLKDHALLNRELDRCNQLGMESSSDARCQTARAAEQQRFFGNGEDKYTPPSSVNLFSDTPSELVPAEREHHAPKLNMGAPHG